MKKNKDGFTLIELLSVIIILGIILAIAVPRILDFINKAKEEAFINSATLTIKEISQQSSIKDLNGDPYSNSGWCESLSGWDDKNGDCLYEIDSDTKEVSINIIGDNKFDDKTVDGSKDNLIIKDSSAQLYPDEVLSCLVNNIGCASVVLPDEYVGSNGQWIPLASKNDLNRLNILAQGTTTSYTFAQDTPFAKTLSITDATDFNSSLFEQRYILVNNIDMKSSAFIPIGDNLRPFGGYFDGNNLTISNLSNALFGPIHNSGGKFSTVVIKNINLNTVNILNTEGSNIGALVKEIGFNTLIKNVRVNGSIESTNSSTTVGGIVGDVHKGLTIENVFFKGNLNGKYNIGGVIGQNHSKNSFKNLSFKGSIINVDGPYTGDVIGLGETNILNPKFNGTITSNLNDVGGVVGTNTGSPGVITNAYISGSITGVNYVGGIIGTISSSSATITNSNVNSTVNGVNYVGGIVGQSNYGTVTYNSFNSTINGSNNVGGIVGESNGSYINNNVSKATVTGLENVGGIIGMANSSTTNNNTSESNVTGTNYIGGIIGLSSSNESLVSNKSSLTIKGISFVGGIVGQLNQWGVTNNNYAYNDKITRTSGTNTYFGRIYGQNFDSTKLGTNYANPLMIEPFINAFNNKVYNGKDGINY